MPVPVIPVKDLFNVYYFQFRIDDLQPRDCVDPKIIIGVCRSKLKIYNDISRTNDTWALSLSTGDKLGNRRWKEYYPVDKEVEPWAGYFMCGSVIGILIDQDRGIISFFKDGNDLGQAFV